MNTDEKLTREQVDQLIALTNRDFPTMSKLVECVSKIGVPGLEKFKNKGNQRKLAEKQLSRYVRVVKKRDIIPDWPKPGTCFIAEVYDPPLPKEDERGKSGKYITLLKPLILSTKEFSGKTYELANKWGLFSEYVNQSYPGTDLNKNIWKSTGEMPPGERRYRAIMDYQVRDKIKYALKSLAGEEKICYEERLMYIPDITVTIEDEDNDLELSYQRLKTHSELREDMCRVGQLIEAIKHEDNYTLSPDDFKSLNLVSSKNNLTDKAQDCEGTWEPYKMEYYRNRQTPIPMKAKPDEVEAYEKYKGYIRYLACLTYLKNNCGHLPNINNLLKNEYYFFQDHILAQIYYRLDSELRAELLSWRSVWKEIYFTVLDKYYQPFPSDEADLCRKKLAHEFVSYMAAQVANPSRIFYGDSGFTDDYQVVHSRRLRENDDTSSAVHDDIMTRWEYEHVYPLKQSTAVHDIQQKLEELYPPIEE